MPKDIHDEAIDPCLSSNPAWPCSIHRNNTGSSFSRTIAILQRLGRCFTETTYTYS